MDYKGFDKDKLIKYWIDDSKADPSEIFNELDDSERFDVQVQLMLMASQIDSRIEPHPISYSDFISGNPFCFLSIH